MDREKFYKGIEEIKNLKISNDEKSLIKSRLDFYVNQNSQTKIQSPWYSFSYIHTRSFAAAFSFVFVVFVGYNTFIFAEGSLPGDKLYSLKVDVIEPLQYSIAMDQVSKATLDTHNLDTRLREAELLELNGKLSDSVLADLESRINTHSESFNSIVNNADSETKIDNNSDVLIDFEAKLNAHSRIIDKIESVSKNKGGNITKIKEAIINKGGKSEIAAKSADASVMMFSATMTEPVSEKVVSETKDLRVMTASTSSVGTTTDDKNFISKKIDTERIIKQTKDSISKVKKINNVSNKILEDAENSIKDAEEMLKNAELEISSGDSEKAYTSLIDSRRKAKEANTTFEVSRELRIDLSDHLND